MFEFFGALFGGAYWIGKIAGARGEEKRDIRHRQRADRITESVKASREQEMDIENVLLNEETRYEMLGTISEELEEVYGENWIEIFSADDSDISVQTLDIKRPYGAAFHILLSKKGLKPIFSSFNYDLMGGELVANRIVKICEMIEKNIQKYHPEHQILFIPGVKHFKDKMHAKTEYYDDLTMGELWWNYNVPLTNSQWNPPIRRLW